MIDKKGIVLLHLKKHGSITQMEAIDLCMATRLSGIIFRLKNEGWPITAVWEDDGNGTRWTRYYLPKGAEQEVLDNDV